MMIRMVYIGVLSVLVVACGGEPSNKKTQTPTPDPASPKTVESCLTDRAVFVSENYPLLDVKDVIRGGLLYDAWWEPLPSSVPGEGEELAIAEPTDDHPLWATRTSPTVNTRTGSATWRCKECHAWDYQGAEGDYGEGSDHFTGFPGLLDAQAKTDLEVFCAVRNLENHAFSAVDAQSGEPILSDAEILTLTKFIIDGIVDTDLYIDPETKIPLKMDATTGEFIPGDPVAGEVFYQTPGNCVQCHGTKGEFNAGEGLGLLALENPWEVLHKIRMGSAGSNPTMRSALDLALNEDGIADVIAYLQQRLSPIAEITAERRAAIRLGGLLFDNHWAESGNSPPVDTVGVEIDNPVWERREPSSPSTAVGAATWRCKNCHGWDYKGLDGRYGAGSPNFTGFPNLLARQEALTARGPDAVFSYLKSGVGGEHAFGVGSPPNLSDDQISALVEFLLLPPEDLPVEAHHLIGMVETADFIFEGQFLGKAKGDVTAGETLYADGATVIARPSCADSACHTDTGGGVATVNLQALATENPWEVLHKARFGQPGVPKMTAVWEWGLDKDAVDILTYIQSLPPIVLPP